ncbi:hypothetical protein ACQP1K_25500 [Sphaerimonospora sp. CA-214678]|uniref:hypothetical protein n=1 Tax=Sphaerimonospora sp. CA-214678 TaxID=3240029 RepID=UPI003D8A0548
MRMRPGRRTHQQYIHLVRLAWDLRELGYGSAVALPCDGEPALVFPPATDHLTVRVSTHDGDWFFTWGRGPGRRVRALDTGAARRIAGVTR